MTDFAAMLDVALDEARAGLAEGGIPIGAALFAADGTLLGRGHNRRVQDDDPSMHAETAAERTDAHACEVLVGEARTFCGGHDWLAEHGVRITLLDDARCVALMADFTAARPELWNEDIGVST